MVSGSAAAAAPVDVFPAAGTPTASPATTVSFRGIAPADLTGVTVVGSTTGGHAGRLRPHPDGNGASFVPNRPFANGERVTVRAGAPLTGASGGAVTFSILRKPNIGRLRKGRPPPQPDPEGTPREARRFHTRHDLRPPGTLLIQRLPRASRDDIFVAPKAGPGQDGLMILDARARPLWWKRVAPPLSAFDFRVQTYRGRPVLTWWQGRVVAGKGRGYGVIADSSYRELRRVYAGNGYRMDQHEFELTQRGTALINVYEPVKWDLSPLGANPHGIAWDSIVQEVDVQSGLVLFEWHSLGDVDIRESYFRVGRAYDSFHVNSVDEEPDGSFLLSGRNANMLCDVDRHSGRIAWRMGGRRSDYRLGPGASLVGQHQALRQPDGTISVFDNGGSQSHPSVRDRPSRGVVLSVDERTKTVRLARQLTHPRRPLYSRSQGSMQPLPGGGAFLSWGGGNPYLTEFDRSGARVFEARFAPSSDDTYRAYRLPWTGSPSTAPDVAAITTHAGTAVYASWNGATAVAGWQVLAGASPSAMRPVASSAWLDFETRVHASGAPRYVSVRARSASGALLGTSATIAPKDERG